MVADDQGLRTAYPKGTCVRTHRKYESCSDDHGQGDRLARSPPVARRSTDGSIAHRLRVLGCIARSSFREVTCGCAWSCQGSDRRRAQPPTHIRCQSHDLLWGKSHRGGGAATPRL